MNHYYNILNNICTKPAGSKYKTVAYKDAFGYPVYDEKTFKPVTQKAKSIVYGIKLFERLDLDKYSPLRERYNSTLIYSQMLELIQNPIDIVLLPEKLWTLNQKIFARPCPLKPRHGFVDSRLISSPKELEDLLQKVKEVDPKGEIVLLPFIEANYNAILCTSGILSVGPGHDGATAGNNSISFPVAPVTITNESRFKSGLSSKSTVFIEAVYTKPSNRTVSLEKNKTLFITQLRGGPSVEQVVDFIPSKIKVCSVVVPHDDLLKWESDVKKFAPGTVVYGKGHTLTSHAAIHCIINKIPFITSFKPELNDVLQPSKIGSFTFNKDQFLLGATAGLFSTIGKRRMLHFAVSVLHNWAYLCSSEHASWLLGMISTFFSKILCALCLGEYRHCQNKPMKIKGISANFNRNKIYSSILDMNNIQFYINKMNRVKKDFTSSSKFRRGFGGSKWAKACKYVISIWNYIAEIQSSKNSLQVKAKKLIALINKTVNLVHNNGWIFNKFAESTSLDKISTRPGLSALELGDIYYSLYIQYKEQKNILTFKKAKELES